MSQNEQSQRFEAKLKRELGDTVLGLLADDRTEDILLNPDSVLWTKRMGEGFVAVGQIPPAQAASAMNTIAAWKGTVMNHDRPILETELPLDGSRFEGIISPVVQQPIFAIRLRPRRIFTLDEYELSSILTHKADPSAPALATPPKAAPTTAAARGPSSPASPPTSPCVKSAP